MGCNKCNSIPCGCSSGVNAYYAESCVQDHCQKIYVQQYKFSVCPESSWNVPLCGQTAVLSVPGIQGITTGASLWHPGYGYFEITSVDTEAGTIGIVNRCPQTIDYQAAPGTQIPACTCFIVTTPAASIDETTQSCVTVGFTAPAEGDSIDITLTTTFGIGAGDIIEIGSGFYFVTEIKPNNIITIRNDGDGLVPGTAVVPLDADGNYQYCIGVLSSTPCTREPVEEGSILACSDEGVTAPLDPDTFNGFNADAISPTLTFTTGPFTRTTTPVTINLINSSPTRPLTSLVTWVMNAFFISDGTVITGYDIEASIDGGPYVSILPFVLSNTVERTSPSNSMEQVVKNTTYSVLPGITKTVTGRATIVLFGGTVSTCSINLEMNTIAISI